jgi:hypothetical protein
MPGASADHIKSAGPETSRHAVSSSQNSSRYVVPNAASPASATARVTNVNAHTPLRV